MSRAAYLVLENGTVFEGKAFGAEKETMGELVFTTAMTGYLETLTDPSYFGQVVLHTFPLIGNYGVIRSDFETPTPALNGYIVREWCQAPSNFRSEGDLDTFLKEKGVTGICGLDTRALTRIVREYGVMNCRIQYTPEVTDEILNELKGFVITEAVEKTTISEIENFPVENAKYHVVLMDFGAKHNIGRELNKRGCNLTVVPAHTKAEEVLALNPDGIMLSPTALCSQTAREIPQRTPLSSRSSESSPRARSRCSVSASVISFSRSHTAQRLKSSSTVTAARTSPSRSLRQARFTSPLRTTATRLFPTACRRTARSAT